MTMGFQAIPEHDAAEHLKGFRTMADETSTPSTTPSAPAAPAQGGYQGQNSGPRPPRPAGGPGGGGRKFFRRKKVFKFCVEKIDAISYRDVRLLQGFIAERGKITPRRLTGVCTTHQRQLSQAIKQSRNIALLPFAAKY